MKQYLFMTIIGLFGIAHSADNILTWKKQTLGNVELHIKSVDDSTMKKTMNEDLQIITRFGKQFSHLKYQQKMADEGIDSIKVRRDSNVMDYSIENRKQTLRFCRIDSNKIIRYA